MLSRRMGFLPGNDSAKVKSLPDTCCDQCSQLVTAQKIATLFKCVTFALQNSGLPLGIKVHVLYLKSVSIFMFLGRCS